jgi:hypothetical protein
MKQLPRHRNLDLIPSDETKSRTRQAAIAEAAYYKAERRSFAPNHELDDWIEAEKELAAKLREQNSSR